MEEKILEQEFLPRPYQIYLYEKAVKGNSIIYLPTGTGKTFIAVLLVKRLSGDLHKPFTLDGKRTIFVVNTVPLVSQQCAFLSRHTGLVCKGYSGDMQVDFWSDEQWREEIETNQILVMTAQIFLNLVTHGVLPLSKVNLIIFDECHRAVKDHPMRQIMQRFEDCPLDQQPRVLAMSASLLNSNVKYEKIQVTLRELEITFHAKIITVDSLSTVTDYATNPKEFIEYYDSVHNVSIMDEIQAIIENAIKILDCIYLPNKSDNPDSSAIFRSTSKTVKLRRIVQDIEEHLNEMGLYGGSKAVLLHMIQLEYLKKNCDELEVVAVLDFLITQSMKIQKLLSHEIGNSEDSVLRYSSPKVLKLLEVLKHFHSNMQEKVKFCCIIFVKRRFTAKVLYHLLKKLSAFDPNFKFLKPEYMVGYNNDPYRNAREQLCLTRWNKEVLVKFRNGSSNCVVATDVVDEGVDIPACTLVIRYYEPQDFRAYIQSKGRARHPTSHFITLASSSDKYMTKYKTFQLTEGYLKTELCNETDDRRNPTNEEVRDLLYTYDIKPYVINLPNGTKSVITEQSAIVIINTYCANLIKSKFIMLTPTWVKEEIQTINGVLYRVHLTLPPVSLLKDTMIGDPMLSIDVAKRSAAMKAAIKLHQIGELDDNLLPKKVEDALINADYLFPCMEKEEKIEGAIPGTNSKKRLHPRVHPEALEAAYPQKDKELFLHIIEMEPNYALPINDNRHLVFYNLLASRKTYGILSSKRMPNLPIFPIFMNVGDLQVSIKVNKPTKSLKQTEIDSLRAFHNLIFDDVLKVIKDFVVFDIHNKDNCYLVVPVNENEEINWEVVNRYKTIESIVPTKPVVVKESDYEFALITPTYRASNVYIVTEICEYLKAESCFPTSDFDSYIDYFKSRHGLAIENASQPLLEVKPISKKINCIKPRRIKANISKRKRANITEDFEEHLVPELCERLDFPSLYWLKATTLPTILHRVSQLLVAEDLRVKIAREIDLELKPIEPNHVWDPLEIKDGFQQNCDSSSNDNEDNEDVTLEDEDMEVDNVPIQDISFDVDVLSQEKSLYSWKKAQEPFDLERNAERIQLIDIEYYYQFMAGVTSEDKKNLKYQNALKSFFISAPKVPVPTLKILNKTSLYGPGLIDVMKGLTAKVSNDVFNLEREETLGDCFLKFAISLFLFQTFKDFGEGPLTFLKGKLVGNLNLFYCGKRKSIPGRMNVEDFSPLSNFITPAYAVDRSLQEILVELEVAANIVYEIHMSKEEKLKGIANNASRQHLEEKVLSWTTSVIHTGMEPFLGVQLVSDKTVSDGVEALIGTYLLHLGIKGAICILKWFEILPKDLNINEFLKSEIPDPKLGTGDVNEHMPWASSIEEKVGYKFQNRAFLLQAFTHPSFVSNRITSSYQRLEFLGDAVLDFLLTVYIYENCGDLSPGELTDLRSALVNNITFACLSVRYGLHTALLAYAPKIFDIVDRFVRFQEDRNHEINDELLWVLLEEEECNMAEHVDVPKVLGDIFESLIGAIYLDSGKNLQTVWNIVYCLMYKEIELFSKNVPKQPIRVIYETQGANPKFAKSVNVEGTKTIMVTLSINVGQLHEKKKKFFHGFGSTKKLAKCAASKQAIKYLRYKH